MIGKNYRVGYFEEAGRRLRGLGFSREADKLLVRSNELANKSIQGDMLTSMQMDMMEIMAEIPDDLELSNDARDAMLAAHSRIQGSELWEDLEDLQEEISDSSVPDLGKEIAGGLTASIVSGAASFASFYTGGVLSANLEYDINQGFSGSVGANAPLGKGPLSLGGSLSFDREGVSGVNLSLGAKLGKDSPLSLSSSVGWSRDGGMSAGMGLSYTSQSGFGANLGASFSENGGASLNGGLSYTYKDTMGDTAYKAGVGLGLAYNLDAGTTTVSGNLDFGYNLTDDISQNTSITAAATYNNKGGLMDTNLSADVNYGQKIVVGPETTPMDQGEGENAPSGDPMHSRHADDEIASLEDDEEYLDNYNEDSDLSMNWDGTINPTQFERTENKEIPIELYADYAANVMGTENISANDIANLSDEDFNAFLDDVRNSDNVELTRLIESGMIEDLPEDRQAILSDTIAESYKEDASFKIQQDLGVINYAKEQAYNYAYSTVLQNIAGDEELKAKYEKMSDQEKAIYLGTEADKFAKAAFSDVFNLAIGDEVFISPTGQGVRGYDVFGGGGYHAPRKDNNGNVFEHQGVDFISEPGQEIIAPFSGKIVYGANNFYNYTGIYSEDGQYLVEIGYTEHIEDLLHNTEVKQGQVIGIAKDIIPQYGQGITNHVHIYLKKYQNGSYVKINPEGYLFP